MTVALVTGGSRGIGAEVCRRLAAEGHSVVVNYRTDHEAARQVVTACEAAGASAVAIQADMAETDAVIAMFEQIDADIGPLGILVNNAGIVAPPAPVADHDIDRWRRIFDINVIGSFLCAREAVRRMSTATGGTGGVIVNVGSAASRLGSANEYVDYAATKGAIDTFTVGLAHEVADKGIRVNAVRPGLIDTEIHASGGQPDRIARLADRIPMQRGGTASEVADTIMFLIGDQSSYVTGALLDVSGGR